MRNDLFQSINSFTLNNVEDNLKEPMSDVLKILSKSNIYKSEKLIKLENDLKNNNLQIKVEPVYTSRDNVGNDMDRVSYGYGYVDFGKESVVYKGKLNKKIIIWSEIVKDFDKQTIIKALLFLLDIYLSIDEEAIFSNYRKMSDSYKRNMLFDYMLPTDIYQNVPIGGFRLSVLDKWCGFYSVAIADIVSTYLTNTNLFFKRRVKFVKTMLKIHNQTFNDMISNREQNNMNYFYTLIPERCAKKIGFFAIQFENYEFKTYSMYMVKKFSLENCIYDYISNLYYLGVMDKLDKDSQEEYISDLLQLSNTFYDENVKVDFRDSVKV